MLRSIGKQSGKSVESVLKNAIIQSSMGPQKSALYTASSLVKPFLQGSSVSHVTRIKRGDACRQCQRLNNKNSCLLQSRVTHCKCYF